MFALTSNESPTTQTPDPSMTSGTPLRSSQSGLLSDSPPPSSQIPSDEPGCEEPPALYDEFNLEGIDQEDLIHWSRAAPEGQRLEDAKLNEKQGSAQSSSSMSFTSKPEAV